MSYCKTTVLLVVVFFLFQAEDGIRDLVRSRGLGDVYKRQELVFILDSINPSGNWMLNGDRIIGGEIGITYGNLQVFSPTRAVSYTHLTLPTSDLV